MVMVSVTMMGVEVEVGESTPIHHPNPHILLRKVLYHGNLTKIDTLTIISLSAKFHFPVEHKRAMKKFMVPAGNPYLMQLHI